MTLILSRASSRYILQLSDRLVTLGASPFDPVSNKTVLFSALGGIAALSYSGMAFIGDLPTDQWIAQQLSGVDLRQFEKPPAMAFRGGRPPLRFGLSLRTLASELTGVAIHNSQPDWLPAWNAGEFEIAILGWQWARKRRPRPIVAWIQKPAGHRQAALQYQQRDWHLRGTVCLGATPSGFINSSAMDRLTTGLKGKDEEGTEGLLVSAIRRVAESSPYVGSDVMSILIAPPHTGYARIRFISRRKHHLELRGAAQRIVLPSAFTPWIVTSSSVFAPSIISGTYDMALPPYTARVEGPPAAAAIKVVSGQARPKRPHRKR